MLRRCGFSRQSNMAMSEAALGLGSNLGDRAAHIYEALRRLANHADIRVKALSRLYQTPPWGPVAQPDFANACALIETGLAPLGLLDLVKGMEVAMGREPGLRWGPRLIDIDILFMAGISFDHPRLHLPHVDMLHRAFVLVPLAEIAPDTEIGGMRIDEAARRVDVTHVVPWQGSGREA
ncbi:MAG: 2-amino-4-hydroxy-6-hydroxymethyldihydropteridine diphosphokinase [Hyphomicrobiales bacterium]|nr:2-amino-4-hydroxy-6-hydroxymethyldihydropteridine diphosphokinase [Hyphomicrobiales bacterium]